MSDMYIADCLYMGSEVSIIAKSELVLKTLISSIGNERGNGDIDVLDIVPSKDVFNIVPDKDVQPVVQGEWSDSYPYKCSVCKSKAPYEYDPYDDDTIMIKSNYCPRCGARMR